MATPLIVTPRDAALWLDFGGQYNAIQGQPNILTDGDMEAADTSAWTNYSGTGSKSTASPHGGLRALRISYDGSHAAGWVRQAPGFAGGNVVQVSGWARGDGTAIPVVNEGSDQFVGTSSTSWQPFNVTFTCTSNQLYLGSKTLGVGNWVEFDDVQVILQNRVTDNLAERGDAPRTVKNGDGTTTASFPTQNVGAKGVTFNGTARFDTGVKSPFEYNQPFSVFFAGAVYYVSGGNTILSCQDLANSNGFKLDNNNGTSLRLILSYDGTFYSGVSCALTLRKKVTIAATYSGTANVSGMNLYVDTIAQSLSTINDTLGNRTIKNGSNFIVGASYNSTAGGSYTNHISNGSQMYLLAVFPLVLTPMHIKNLDRYARRCFTLP